VPVGCLSLLVLFVAFVGSVALIVFSAMRSTDVYKEALARAKANSAVISGPNGKGTIYVAATKSLGRWNYSGLIVEIAKTHQRIDLLQSPVPANSS
jgi:hypothetical protein